MLHTLSRGSALAVMASLTLGVGASFAQEPAAHAQVPAASPPGSETRTPLELEEATPADEAGARPEAEPPPRARPGTGEPARAKDPDAPAALAPDRMSHRELREQWRARHDRALRRAVGRLADRAATPLLHLRRRVPPRFRPHLRGFEDWMTGPDGRRLAAVWLTLLVALGIGVRSLGRTGELVVSIEYPAELRGTFSVRLSRRKPAVRKAGRRSRGGTPGRSRPSTRMERHLVAREARFERLAPGRYWVRIEGRLEDPGRGARLREIVELRQARVGSDAGQRVEIDLRTRGCPLEVRVAWDGLPVDQATVALRSQPDSLRYTRNGTATLELPLGLHRVLIGSGDRVAEYEVDLRSHEIHTLEVELAGSERLVFKGCPPAVGLYLQGDTGGAARALEREGQLSLSHLLLARHHQDEGRPHRAAEHFESAGELQRAAEIFVEQGDPVRAAQVLRRSAAPQDVDRALQYVAELAPTHERYAEARELLADLLMERDEHADALQVLEDLQRTRPGRDGVDARIDMLRKRLASESDAVERSRTQPLRQRAPAGSSRYDILEQIGRGGMGVVFKARDRRLGRLVALKQLPENLRDHPTAIELFEREARAAAALNHPNIVTLYDADEENGTFFITMELLEGLPLHQILRREGRLSTWRCCQLGVQIAAGLGYAHHKRIVHRDIKTANLFWTRDKTLKIMDFGLSKMLEEVRRANTVIGGTPYYAAPEQITGAEVDGRADLYAFGVTLFEMATGSVPFREGDVLLQHRDAPAPDPRTLAPEIDADFAELVVKLMAKRPEDRVQTAHEVAQRLATCARPS